MDTQKPNQKKANQKVAYSKKQVISWLESRFPEIDFSEVEERLPPLIWRNRWNDLADRHGLPYRRGYLQNLDSEGIGPSSVSA